MFFMPRDKEIAYIVRLYLYFCLLKFLRIFTHSYISRILKLYK